MMLGQDRNLHREVLLSQLVNIFNFLRGIVELYKELMICCMAFIVAFEVHDDWSSLLITPFGFTFFLTAALSLFKLIKRLTGFWKTSPLGAKSMTLGEGLLMFCHGFKYSSVF